MYEATETINQ